MNKALALLAAATFALLSASALADDKTSANVTPADQAKMKQEAAAKKAAAANMTKEQKAAAKKTLDQIISQYGGTEAAHSAESKMSQVK